MSRPIVAITVGRSNYERMFSDEAWRVLDEFADVVHHEGADPATADELMAVLTDADACVTSWGVAQFDEQVMAQSKSLKAMAHLGSSVKRFVSPALWEAGVHVTTAGIVLARDVAETTLGLMIVGRKGLFPLAASVRSGRWTESLSSDRHLAKELNRSTVGIVGASNVGRHVMKLLSSFDVEILLSDPFVTTTQAEELGATKVELPELLVRSHVVSLHAPSTAQTRQMLNAETLAMMRADALLINTARGDLIDQPALIANLAAGRFFAFLDVTDPEPPDLRSQLLTLPNVVVTPHVAGCIDNCHRMGELGVEELRRFFAGEDPIYAVTQDMLDRIA